MSLFSSPPLARRCAHLAQQDSQLIGSTFGKVLVEHFPLASRHPSPETALAACSEKVRNKKRTWSWTRPSPVVVEESPEEREERTGRGTFLPAVMARSPPVPPKSEREARWSDKVPQRPKSPKSPLFKEGGRGGNTKFS